MDSFVSKVGLLTLIAFSANASPTPGDQDLIRDRQDRLLQEQQRRLQDLKDLPGNPAAPVQPSAPAVDGVPVAKVLDIRVQPGGGF